MSADGDQNLLLAAGRGDQEAFCALVQRQHVAILRFIQRFLGGNDRAAAEDLAQDVFLAAWKAAPTYEASAKVITWLLRIATNLCLNQRRAARLRATVPLAAEDSAQKLPASADRPEARLMASEQAVQVRAAIAALPPNQRAAILLRHFHDLCYEDIAAALGVSVSAVESLLFRARQALQAALTEPISETPPQVLPRLGVNPLGRT